MTSQSVSHGALNVKLLDTGNILVGLVTIYRRTCQQCSTAGASIRFNAHVLDALPNHLIGSSYGLWVKYYSPAISQSIWEILRNPFGSPSGFKQGQSCLERVYIRQRFLIVG